MKILALIIALCLPSCSNLTPEERAALLNFGLHAGESLLVKAAK